MKKILSIIIFITLIFFTGCTSDNSKIDKNNMSSESQNASANNSASEIKKNTDAAAPTEVKSNDEYIIEIILSSELAELVGKTEREIEAKFGPPLSEGEWFNGLLYTQHENFSGSIGYRAADPGSAIESIEADSICNTIAFKLSEIVPIENISFNKKDLKFICDDGEGDYYYIFKNIDAPIQIGSDKNGDIEPDPWIFVYSEHQ